MALAMQMQALAFDFAEGLVVGLGIKGEEKALLLKKWTEFSSNTFTFVVSREGSHTTTFSIGLLAHLPVAASLFPWELWPSLSNATEPPPMVGNLSAKYEEVCGIDKRTCFSIPSAQTAMHWPLKSEKRLLGGVSFT